MRLITGPAGSGKTFRVLEHFREALRRREHGVCLLTPTATMAQHLQNRMAREGFVFRPQQIQTFSRFVDSLPPGQPQVSGPLLYLIVEEAAKQADRPEFSAVVNRPGFCAAVARAIEELSSAGCPAARLEQHMPPRNLAPLGKAFLDIYRAVERELERRGLATRAQRLALAAERLAATGHPSIRTVWMDGFFALPDPELAVIRAMCLHMDVTLTLPTAAVTESTRARLLGIGFTEECCAHATANTPAEICVAPTIEREADEIARRILAQAASGRPFHDIGVIVRSPEVYQPILRVTLDRFAIPARFYFDSDLHRHTLIRFLTGIVDALLGGWEHAATLATVRLAPAIASDKFDFLVREQEQGHGLAPLMALAVNAEPAVLALLQSFEKLESWRALSVPSAEWAAHLNSLREFALPRSPAPDNHENAAILRGHSTALTLFTAALDQAAEALAGRPIRLAEFWRTTNSLLRLTPLRVEDARRNVVHVLGAHEARQWRLPIVFVCGLVEKQFPKFHTPDPFLPEAARAHWNRTGIRLRTAAEFEAEERFLFDSAVSRATESLTLTYPQTDARGQQNLPSQFLLDFPAALSAWQPVRPHLQNLPAPPRAPAAIAAPDLLAHLTARHHAVRLTSLETYLQCAFQFFGRDTLRLRPAPARPEDRLDFLTQGNIVHGALAAYVASQRPIEEVFNAVFAQICEKQHVPPGFRTESSRLRMLADLRALVADPRWLTQAPDIRTEQKFSLTLEHGVEISGRIDRMDVTPDGAAYVIDYKYSASQRTRDLVSDENLALKLQPQIYMLAVERFFRLRPEGMAYWGLKGGVQQTAWLSFDPQPAIETIERIAGEIRAGRIEPRPADADNCRFCDYRDVCRFVAAAPASVEEVSTWD
jgi:ATP-dependent helicase/DNAse subunit B